MNIHVNAISNRLSLRQPQRDSLEILARVCEIISLKKGSDAAKALETIKSEFSTVREFDDRDFPSLCFALVTGVGKTRLMGAFIAYLSRAEGIQHFFVLAPNLTIYNKLVADFTAGTPKYVFNGIADSRPILRRSSLVITTKVDAVFAAENYSTMVSDTAHRPV
jgi:type III restriction enzyme